MAIYSFAYRLENAPQSRLDGSGQVGHDIQAVYREAGSGDSWQAMPSHHKTILVSSSGLKTVMDVPDSNAAEKQAKNTVYKQLLRDNNNTQADPMQTHWNSANFPAFMDNNDNSILEADRANDYLVNVLHQDYPIPFQI